jgi:hypothetical protein
MSKAPFIDRVVVNETKERLAEHARHMQYGIEAADFYSDLIFAKAVELAAGQMQEAEEKRSPRKARR